MYRQTPNAYADKDTPPLSTMPLQNALEELETAIVNMTNKTENTAQSQPLKPSRSLRWSPSCSKELHTFGEKGRNVSNLCLAGNTDADADEFSDTDEPIAALPKEQDENWRELYKASHTIRWKPPTCLSTLQESNGAVPPQRKVLNKAFQELHGTQATFFDEEGITLLQCPDISDLSQPPEPAVFVLDSDASDSSDNGMHDTPTIRLTRGYRSIY